MADETCDIESCKGMDFVTLPYPIVFFRTLALP